MNFITSIANDFYGFSNIPVKVMSSRLDEVYSIGYTNYFKSIFPFKEVSELINLNDNNLDINLKINNSNISYKILSIPKFNDYNYILVIGPVSSEFINNNINSIPYKSLNCLNYISKFIFMIFEDKFNDKVNSKNFNPYIRKSIEYIHLNYSQDISISSICDYLEINKSYFCSLFKKCTGITFSSFLNRFRIEKSKELLLKSDLSLMNIAIAVGFNNQNYYSIVFKKYTNLTPSNYRRLNS